jgi:hypothetical protein
MPANLSLTSEDLSAVELDALAREFEAAASALHGLELRQVSLKPPAGTRGDFVTVGTFALAIVTSGALAAFFNLIRSYVERGLKVSFEGTTLHGKEIKFQIQSGSIEEFRMALKDADILK